MRPLARAAPAQGAHRIRQRHLPGQQHRQHRQDVVDIEFTDQAHASSALAPAGLHLDHRPLGSGRNARRAHEARPRGHRAAQARGDDQGRSGAGGGQLRTEGVVDVDHAVRQVRPRQQPRLGGAVGLHRAVIVQMVARQVGENRRVEAHAVDAPLVEGVRGDFHAHALGAQRAQLRQLTLQRDGIGGRVQRRGDLRRAAKAEGADIGCGTPALLERLRQQPRAGGLAVGAGDPGDGELLRGRIEEAVGDDADALAEPGHRRGEGAGRQLRGLRGAVRFVEHRARPAGDRLRGEFQPMVGAPAAGQEQGPGSRRAAVESEITHHDAPRAPGRSPR